MRRELACLALLCVAVPAAAQRPLIRLTPNAGEVGAELRAERRGYTRSPSAEDEAYREWIRIPLSGMFLSPQLLTYEFALRPIFGQQRTSGFARQFITRSTGVDFSASMLQTPYTSLLLFSTRAAGSAEGGFGGESFFHSSGRGVSARLNTAYLPLHAEVSERKTDDVWHASVSSTPLRRLERLTTARVGGSNSKTTLIFDQQRYEDRIGTQSFASRNLMVAHRARWGRGGALETTIERGVRHGSDQYVRSIWAERLALQHSRALNSDWHYQTRESNSMGIASAGSVAGGSLRYEARHWLTTSLQGTRLTTRYAQGRSKSLSIAPRVSLRRELFPGGFLAGGLALTAENVRREITDGEWVEVAEERHRIEPARVFTLDRLHGDAASVVVRSADLVQRYEAGLDYRVVVLGPLIRVQLIPGSRIAVGDVVALNYRYRLLIKTPHRITRTTLDAAFTTPHVAVTHNQNWRHLTLLAGPPTAVPPEGDDRATGVNLYSGFGGTRLSLELEERSRLRSTSDFRSRELRATVAPAWAGRWHASLGGALARTEANGRTMDVMSGSSTLGVVLRSALRLQVTVDAWMIDLPDAAREFFFGKSLEVDWRIGRIETEWRYWHQSRTAELTGVQQRFWLRLVRRF